VVSHRNCKHFNQLRGLEAPLRIVGVAIAQFLRERYKRHVPSGFLEDSSQSREARRQHTAANAAFGKRLSLTQSNNYTFQAGQ
jgi:hypothetical protein